MEMKWSIDEKCIGEGGIPEGYRGCDPGKKKEQCFF